MHAGADAPPIYKASAKMAEPLLFFSPIKMRITRRTIVWTWHIGSLFQWLEHVDACRAWSRGRTCFLLEDHCKQPSVSFLLTVDPSSSSQMQLPVCFLAWSVVVRPLSPCCPAESLLTGKLDLEEIRVHFSKRADWLGRRQMKPNVSVKEASHG